MGLFAGEHSIKNFLCCNGCNFLVYCLFFLGVVDLKVCKIGGVERC